MTIRHALFIIGCASLCGCLGDLVPLQPVRGGEDLGGTTAKAAPPDLGQPVAAADLAGAPATDDAGSAGAPDQAAAGPHFFPEIQADVEALGCTSAGCHGGSLDPVLKAGPASDAERMANHSAFLAMAMDGASSAILVKPLTGSGTSHAGGKLIASTSDPVYVRWLAWIQAGGPL